MTPLHFTWCVLPATGWKGQGKRRVSPNPRRPGTALHPSHPWPTERAYFLPSLQQQAVPRARAESRVARIGTAWDFHCSRAQGGWASPVWASGFPKMYNFRSWKEDIFSTPQNVFLLPAPNYFIIRLTAKKTRESSFPWCLAPAEAGTGVPGTQDLTTPRPQSIPLRLPFFLTLSPPLCPLAPTQTVCTGSLPL